MNLRDELTAALRGMGRTLREGKQDEVARAIERRHRRREASMQAAIERAEKAKKRGRKHK